jgi:hypothetical protein
MAEWWSGPDGPEGSGNVVVLRTDWPATPALEGQSMQIALRRASAMIEEAAYNVAGRESPMFISRLIEIAAELERIGRGGSLDAPRGGAQLKVCAAD